MSDFRAMADEVYRLDEELRERCRKKANVISITLQVDELVSSDGRVLKFYPIDYPSVAEAFGFEISSVAGKSDLQKKCDHFHTNGASDCPECGMKTGRFVHAAKYWIVGCVGHSIPDPGFFQLNLSPWLPYPMLVSSLIGKSFYMGGIKYVVESLCQYNGTLHAEIKWDEGFRKKTFSYAQMPVNLILRVMHPHANAGPNFWVS